MKYRFLREEEAESHTFKLTRQLCLVESLPATRISRQATHNPTLRTL